MKIEPRSSWHDAAAMRRLRLAHAKVEKAQDCGPSTHDDGDLRERRGPQPTRRRAYRFDTAGRSPWHAPALDPRYAAQVIGQAVGGGAGGPTAPYRALRFRASAFLYDQKF